MTRIFGDADVRHARAGTVYLVGAGPGDPGLLTMRAHRILVECDAIVYDRLAATVLPPDIAPDHELIYVGKRASHHSMPQDEINALLVRLAKEGRKVCRLKGGDPFVFGRGGEEAEVLAAEDIPFEVVPGVTAGIAAPAYAGIPVTNRGEATRISLITAHEDPTKAESQVDWRWLGGDANGTIAAYMPVSNLPHVVERLIEGGLDPQTPAAVIERGTLCCQRTIAAPLVNLPDRLASEQVRPPALFIVGRTVAHHESLAWFEEHPLRGKRVVVTRPADQSPKLIAALRAAGIQPLVFPVIRTVPVETEVIETLRERIGGYDWIFFTSENGVRYFFDMLWRAGLDVRAIGGARLAAVGSGTAARLADYGLRDDFQPTAFRGQVLLDEFVDAHAIDGRRMLRVRGDRAPTILEDGMRQRGAEVDTLLTYRLENCSPREDVVEELAMEGAAAVTFTSASAIHGLEEQYPEHGLHGRAVAVCIGPVTAKAAAEAGWQRIVTAQTSTIAGLVETLVAELEAGA